MSQYPRYSTWSDVRTNTYEIVRWTDAKTMEVVQTNIRTFEKAHQALAEWNKRAAITRSHVNAAEPPAPITVHRSPRATEGNPDAE